MREQVTMKLAETSRLGREGDVVTLDLQVVDVHVPEEISTYLGGYKNFESRADEISPIVLVDKDTDYYRDMSSDDAFQPVDVKINMNGPHKEIDVRSSATQYQTIYRAIGSYVGDDVAVQTRWGLRQAASRRCFNVVDMDREIDAVGLLTTTTSFSSNNRLALGAGANWDGGVDSDPVENIQRMILQSSQTVTAIDLNQADAFALLRHPAVRDQYRQYKGDAQLEEAVANVYKSGMQGATSKCDFMIPGLPVFRVHTKRKKNETTLALDFIWPTGTVVGSSSPPGVPMDGETIATSKTFRRRGVFGTGWTTREYRIENRGLNGGSMIMVGNADIAKITSNTSGFIITGAHS